MERTRLVGEIDLTNQSEHWTLVHVSDTLPSETPEKRVWHHDYDHFEEAMERFLDGVASQWRGYSFDVESIKYAKRLLEQQKEEKLQIPDDISVTGCYGQSVSLKEKMESVFEYWKCCGPRSGEYKGLGIESALDAEPYLYDFPRKTVLEWYNYYAAMHGLSPESGWITT